MNQFEAYLLLFTDTFVSSFAFYTSSEIAFDAMQMFGGYSNTLIVLVSITAYVVSVCVNYLLGIICYKILSPVNKNENELDSRIHKIQNFKFLPIIIALSFVPFFGKFIVLFSGFCKIKFRLVFIVSVLVKLAYYIILIFSP